MSITHRWMHAGAVASCLWAAAPATGQTPAPAPLPDRVPVARAVATEGLKSGDSKVAHLTDGDPATYWHGSGQALTEVPASLMLLFGEPETVDRVAITSQVFKDRLRLKAFALYAKADGGWAGAAPLAVVRDNTDVRRVCQFEPVTTDGLRIRILDTWRPDHAYPRICEVEIGRAGAGAAGRRLPEGAIPDETEYERLLCEWALGTRSELPRTRHDPAKGWLHYAQTFADTMLAAGTDIYGDVHSPMFTSILMVTSRKHPGHRLPSLEGQRAADRAAFGGNLFHDVTLLLAMDRLSDLTGDDRYRRGVDAYLRTFLATCPASETGLFPWGEHAHWDFAKDAPGHRTHEYLGGVPVAFWERLWAIDPSAVRGEADGLINHVVDLEAFAWNRHADIGKPLPEPRPKGLRVADFPRHGGFYILLWTFVHSKTEEGKYLDWALRAIDHSWRLKREPLNLPPFTASSGSASVESAFSQAISLLEAAQLLPAGGNRERYRHVAHTYLDAFLRLPHRPAKGEFVTSCKLDAAPSEAKGETVPWTAAYGGKFTADDAVLCCAAHRLTGKPGFLDLARAVAGFYAGREPPPADQIVRAHVYAAVITLFLDVYDQTREQSHLDQARRYAKTAVERLYWNGLFRGATGVDHYESQLMVGNLVYALVWLHALESEGAVRVGPNYFNR